MCHITQLFSFDDPQSKILQSKSSSKAFALTMTKGPVIIITGTPGTGKTTHAQYLVNESPIPLKNINVSDWVKERDLFEEYDQEWQSHTVDEDRVRLRLILSSIFMKNH